MSPKETMKKPVAQKTMAQSGENGSRGADEHLAKANRAMTKAWNLISRRKHKSV